MIAAATLNNLQSGETFQHRGTSLREAVSKDYIYIVNTLLKFTAIIQVLHEDNCNRH